MNTLTSQQILFAIFYIKNKKWISFETLVDDIKFALSDKIFKERLEQAISIDGLTRIWTHIATSSEYVYLLNNYYYSGNKNTIENVLINEYNKNEIEALNKTKNTYNEQNEGLTLN